MKKLLLLFVGLFITLASFAQPSFYRAYSKSFGVTNDEDVLEWGDPEASNTLISVEGDKISVYAKQTTTIFITKDISVEGENSLMYEGIDDEGGDVLLLFSKTDEGANYFVIKYTYAAVLFFIRSEQ